jgi:hypothetical protein
MPTFLRHISTRTYFKVHDILIFGSGLTGLRERAHQTNSNMQQVSLMAVAGGCGCGCGSDLGLH